MTPFPRKNRNRRPTNSEGESWLLDHVRQHPFKTSSLAILVLGGVLVLLFFAHLRTMPDIDIASSTSVFASVALVGLLVTGFLAVSTVLPGFVARVNAKGAEWKVDRTTLLLCAAPGFGLIILVIVQLPFERTLVPAENLFPLCLLMSWVIADARIEHLVGVEELDLPQAGGWKSRLKHHFTVLELIYTSIVWTACIGVGFLFIIGIYSDISREAWRPALVVLAWTIYCCGLSVGAARVQSARDKLGILFAAAGGVVMILVTTQNVAAISISAVRALGLGEIPARLVVLRPALI